MTAEEALHICKLATKCAMFDQQCTDMTEFIDAMKQKYDLEVMVDCIQKQIPQKPRETRCALMCARCGHKITEKGCKKLYRNYCKKCGQRISWEDEE